MTELEKRIERLEKRVNLYRNTIWVLGLVLGTFITLSAPINPEKRIPVSFQNLSQSYADDSSDLGDADPFRAYKNDPAVSQRAAKQAGPETMTVKEIFIQNDADSTVAYLGFDENGGVLEIKNNEVRAVTKALISPSGNGSVQVRNNSGSLRGHLGVSSSLNGFVSVYNKADSLSTFIGSGRETGNGYLRVRNSLGISTFYTGSGQTSNHGYMRIRNNQGVSTFYTGSGGEIGDGFLRVRNGAGNQVSYLGAGPSGSGLMTTQNREGLRTTYAGINTVLNGGIITVFNELERVVIYASTKSDHGLIQTHSAEGDTTWSSLSGGGVASSSILGDFDGDGDVDFTDFLTFAGNFGKKF